MVNQLFIFMGFFIAGLFLVLIDISSGAAIPYDYKLVILFLALLFDMLAFTSRYYSYLFMPIIKQRSRNLVISTDPPYWISTTSDSILHKEGDSFVATVYVKIPYYLSASEMNDNEKIDFTKQVGRLASISRDPIRFTTQMHIMDKDSYLRSLRDNLNQAEAEQARLMAGEKVSDSEARIKGKASMWYRLLDKVTGTISFELVSFASASGRGAREFEAINAAQQRSREMMSAIASIMGVSPSIVTGEDLLRLVEPEHMIPYSTVSEAMSKSLREQVA